MQTPLMELIEWIDDYYELNKCVPYVHNTKKKATEQLEKEREVIENAYNQGSYDARDGNIIENIDSSDYFTKTFTDESK